MARQRDVYSQGEYVRTDPIASEGKFLLSWIDMDTTEMHVEGTWQQIQDYIVSQLDTPATRFELYNSVLTNSREEILSLQYDR